MRVLLLLFVMALIPFPCVTAQEIFPQDFLGRWQGTLEVFGPDTVLQRVAMQLHIEPLSDSSYTYTIIYGEADTGTRAYELRRGTDGPNHWVVDEKNGILLDNYFRGGVLTGGFAVMGNLLVASLERRGEALLYRIVSGKQAPRQTTGGQPVGGQDIPPVDSYALGGLQQALLRRVTD